MKLLGGLILGVVGVTILGFGILYAGTALKLFTLPWFKFDTQVNQNAKIIDKTYNADNQIYNYHWFQERYASIGATKTQIQIAQRTLTDFETNAGPRSSWTFEDKTEDSRLRAVVQGLQNKLESDVNEYNARANEADRSIFVDGLKTFIPLN
jgi:hypothetical protein